MNRFHRVSIQNFLAPIVYSIFSMLLISVVIPTSCTATDLLTEQETRIIEHQARLWCNTYAPHLTPEELKAVAITLYYSSAHAFYDAQMRQQSQQLLMDIKNLQQKLYTYTDDNEQSIKNLSHTIINFQKIITTNHAAYTAWGICIGWIDGQINKNQSGIIAQAFNELSIHGQKILEQHAQKQTEQFNDLLAQTTNSIDNACATLKHCTNIFHTFLHNAAPSEITESETQAPYNTTQQIDVPQLIHIDSSIKVAQVVSEKCWNMIENTAALSHQHVHLEQLTTIFFSTYYKIVYEYLERNNYDLNLYFADKSCIDGRDIARKAALPDPHALNFSSTFIDLNIIRLFP